MNRIGRMIAAIALGLASTGLSAAMVESVKTTTYYPWNGQVKVAYDVKGVEAGSTYQLGAKIRAGGKNYAVASRLITADGGYDFVWDAAAAGFEGRDENVTVTISIEEPSFVIVDLDTVVGGKYAISYAVEIADPNVDDYKLGKMLFKRVGTQYVGVFEVTQYQYEKVMGTNPAYFSKYAEDKTVAPRRPVERVSYEALTETSGFFDRLQTSTGLPFTLPSGEDWEEVTSYGAVVAANRAYNVDNGVGVYWAITGKDQDKTWMPLMGRYIDLWDGTTKIVNGNNRWNEYSDGTHGTAVVGSYKPTDTGLYDIHGNVSEWTTDEDSEGHHILRGGNFLSSAEDCALTAKLTYKDADASQLYKAGFRVFGDAEQIGGGFVHGSSTTSDPFAVDVDSDNVRNVTVKDNNDGTYTFSYVTWKMYQANKWVINYSIPWVALTDMEDWYPTEAGDNVAENETTGEQATFKVTALTFKDIVVTGYEGVYDGYEHTGSVKTEVKNTTIKYGTTEGVYTLDKPPAYKNASTYTVYYEVSNPFYTTVTGSFTVKITPLTIDADTTKIKLTPDTLIYNRTEQVKTVSKVTVQGAQGELTLAADVDYEVEVTKHTDATYAKDEEETGYKLTITGKGNYTGEKTVDWGIRKAQIDGRMTITPESFVYDGAEKKPTITKVTSENKTLELKTDEYLDQTKGEKVVGNYTAKVISDSKNFEGSAEANWSITARDFDTVTISLDKYEYIYDGKECKPVVTVTDSGRQDTQTLKEGVDYYVEWPDDRVNASEELTITVTGKGNYAAVSKTVTYTIKQATIDSLTLNKAELTYNGKEQKVTVKSVVTKNGVEVSASDYDLTGEAETNAKTYKAKVTAKKDSRNFTGEATAEWQIDPLNLSEPNVVEFLPVDPALYGYVYDGMPKTAVVEKVAIKHPDGIMVTNDCKVGFTLEDDYIKTDVGKYTVRVVGKDNITGERKADWEIKENTENIKVELSASEFVYNGVEQRPTVTVSDLSRKDTQTLTEGVDYDIEWPDDCKNASEKITITIKGKGNYSSLSKTADYKIVKAGIKTLTLNTTSFAFDNTEKTVTVKSVTTTNGVTVTDADYDFTGDTKGTAANTYTAKVTAKATSRNFHGSAEATWTINKRSIGNATITIPNLTYNREVQTPSITVEDSGAKITADDYTYVIEPSEVKLAGDYVVTFTATKAGNYSGEKKVQFKVEKATITSMTLDKEALTYNGQKQKVTVTSVTTANGVSLLASEYGVTGNTGTDAKGYTAKVTLNASGSANFKGGPLTKDWKIDPLDISGATISVTEPVYDGTEKTVTINSVTKDGLTVTYTVKSGNKGTTVEGGPYTLVVTGNGNFKGDASTTWNLKQATITSVELDGQLVWNGKSEVTIKGTAITRKIVTPASKQAQKVIVKVGEQILTEADYSITGNVQSEAGQYTLSVTAKGNYTGTISDVIWTIKPTPVIITPNVLNPTELAELLATGTARIMMAAEDENWTVWYTKHTFKDGVAQPESKANPFRTFNIKERTVVTGWAVSKDGNVSSDKMSVDYKMGMTAEPVSVLQDMSKLPDFEIPVYDDSGLAKTNLVTGLQEPTNFFNNGQLVFLSRGNLNSKGAVIEGTEEEKIYTDGSLAYTLDGTEPVYTNGVLEGTTKVWTNGVSVIAITNTTTVIAKVFGDQYFDSDPITNVFVRERSQFAKPAISYRCDPTLDFVPAEEKQSIDKMPVEIKIERTDEDKTFGRLVYSTDGGATTNVYAETIKTSASIKVMAWVEDVNYELEPSEKVTAEFICDGQLAKPTTEFNKDDQALAQYQVVGTKTFKNKKQVIDLKRADTGLTKDTDGVLRYSLDEGVTWTTNVTQVTIWGTTDVWVQAIQSTQGLADSEICKDTYTQTPDPVTKPVVSFNKTKTVKQMEVVIESDQGATIYYTLDGTTPIGINQSGTTSTKYTGAFIYDIDVEETLEVKAIAYKEDGAGDFSGRSEVGSGSFTRKETIADVIKSDDPAKQAKPDQPDTSDLPFDNSDNKKWQDSEGTEFDTAWRKDENEATTVGGSSLRSGDVRDGDEGEPERISTLKVKVMGPGKITFNWKSSTEFVEGDPETAYDFGTFYVDGVAVEYIWGTNDWSEVTYTINETSDVAQEHELKWTYEKDWMDDEEQAEELGIEDCIWVDDFVWTCVPDMKQMSIVQSPELTYNQNPQSPTFIVTLTNEQGVVVATLQEGKDYTIEATEVAEAGEYDYTLHATGTNYTGSVSGKWTIGQLSIDNAIVTLSDGQMYTRKDGKVVEQYATVESIKVGGLELVNDATWTVEGTNATERGTYTATITGSDGLTGSVSTNWVIAPRPITTDMIAVPTDIVYFGSETNVTTSADFKVVYEGESIYYTVESGAIATNAETYTVSVKAVENQDLKDYTGVATKDWTIAKFDFDQHKSSLVLTNEAFVYNGSEHTNEVDYVLGNHPVFGAVTFTNEAWVISNNVATAAGEYWAKLYPLENGNFCGGPISNKWTIVPCAGEVDVRFGPWPVYEGGATELSPTITSVTSVQGGLTLVEDRDYTVEYASNTKYAQHGTLTIVGKGNFDGLRQEASFEILPEQIENTTIDLTDWSYVYDGKEKVPVITMTLPNGKVVKMDQSPQKDGKKIGGWMILDGSKTNETNVGSYQIDFAGYYDYTETAGSTYTGNIKGSTNVTWTITERPIENVTITIPDLVYNREVQEPKITVEDPGAKITVDDYTYVIEPSEVKTAGVYKVTFTAKGNYKNTTNVTFNVLKAQVDGFKLEEGATTLTYNGQEQSVSGLVTTTNALTLTSAEYHLENGTGTNAGKYTVSVVLDDENFEFKDGAALTADWWILQKEISDSSISVTLANDIIYTAKEQKIEDADIATIMDGNLPLKSWKVVSSDTGVNVGKYRCKVEPDGDNNFKGEASFEWEIKPRDIKAAEITWKQDRLLWNGTQDTPASEQTPEIDTIKVGGPDTSTPIEFKGDLATLTVNDGDKIEAGAYTSTITGTGNFTNTTTLAQKWEIAPKSPLITPSDRTGKYTKLADWITVEINNDTADQLWSIYYTTNDWVDTLTYDYKGNKFDIDQHMIIQTYAVSVDGCVTSDTSCCEYFFAKQNKEPTIALTAKAGAEEGRPDYAGTTVEGVEKLVMSGNDFVTNFYHTGAKVALTRFGTWDQQTIDEEIAKETTGKGLCPLTDGEIWYTMAVGDGAEIVSPTNVVGFGSVKYVADDASTWPTLTTNTVIVAKVFGGELESSAEVTNAFRRLWTTVPAPGVTGDATFHLSQTVTITTNDFDGADWTTTNANQKIYVKVNGGAEFLYTNAFELTWKDCVDEKSVVTVFAKYGVETRYGEGDYLESTAVTRTFTHEKQAFAMPTLTPDAEFKHALPDGFTVSLTNNAALNAGGVLQYAIDDGEFQDCVSGSEAVDRYDFNVSTTSVVRVRVFANENAHDYYTSATNEAKYTYSPYQMVAPTVDKADQTFTTKDFTFTIALPAEETSVKDYEHLYHGTLCYSLNGGAWQEVDGSSKEFTVSETTVISVKQTKEDHLDSNTITRTYTRKTQLPEIKLVDEKGEAFPIEIEVGATNYFHKAFLTMTGAGGDTHVEYVITEGGKEIAKGTFTANIAVSNTFTVTAQNVSVGGTKSEPVTATFTRKWETLIQPKIELLNPYGVYTNEFRYTADCIAITNLIGQGSHEAADWPESGVTITYAVVTNSVDTETIPAAFAPFVPDVTESYFKADSNAVWAIVSADDYLPSTNKCAFIRKLDDIAEPVVAFDNDGHRRTVEVSIELPKNPGEDDPEGLAIYYTYAITNNPADVDEPFGSEYDVAKATARYTGAFKVALMPDEKLIVKARAYVEDASSEGIIAETNFTARSAIGVYEFSYPRTIGDVMDAPDQVFTVSDSIAKKTNTNCVEDISTYSWDGEESSKSSMVFTNLVDNETVTLSTTVVGPGTVVFDWRTLCEVGQHGYNRDYFAFSVDGTEVALIDGDSGWQTYTYKIDGAMGTVHTLSWTYKKEISEKQLADCAWVDHFQWTSGLQMSDISNELRTWTKNALGDDYYEMLINPGCEEELDNWRNVLGMASAVTDRSYWDCYVLGLDPDDWMTDFTALEPEFEYTQDESGQTVLKSVTISWTPCTKAGRTYTLVGKKELIDDEWDILEEANATVEDESEEGGAIAVSMLNARTEDYKFFQLRVRMTK